MYSYISPKSSIYLKCTNTIGSTGSYLSKLGSAPPSLSPTPTSAPPQNILLQNSGTWDELGVDFLLSFSANAEVSCFDCFDTTESLYSSSYSLITGNRATMNIHGLKWQPNWSLNSIYYAWYKTFLNWYTENLHLFSKINLSQTVSAPSSFHT